MADDNHKVKIDLDVSTTGEDTVNSLIRALDRLETKQKAINASLRSIGRPSSTPGGSPTKEASAVETVKARGRRSKARSEADSVKTAQRINLFDRDSVRLFQTKLTSQTKATTEALRAERQTFANFKTRNAAQARYETAQVRALKDRMNAERRIASMRIAHERATATAQARTASEAARATTRRMQDAANAIRATARLEEQETRRVDRARTSRENARNRYISNVRSGGESIREGTGRAVRGSAAISAAATGTAALAARKGISTRMEVDTQETNLKIFSGQSADQIKAARKGFLDNEAIRNGLSIAGGLETYSEVLKTGMKAPEANTKNIMQAVSALELDLKNTTKLAGLIDRNLGARSDPAKIKSALNAVAVAAREDPTQSNEIVEGVKRSFGALSTGNLTPEQLTAMVSGGQSVGIQPGKAGTFVATMAKQLSMGSSKFLGKKNREELDFAAKELGFGDARSLAQTYSKDSYNTMMQVHEKLANMEAAKRTQVAEALYGRQWSDEGLQMAQGVGGVRKTYGEISDSKNANFLEEAAKQRAESLQGQWNSTKSIFGRFWDAFGQGFEDILTSINKYFLELDSKFDYDQIKGYVVSFFDGVKEALGVKTWAELLHSIFGGELGNIGPQIKAFAKGLTEGVMAVGRAIRSFASVFGGSDMSADTMGKLTGEFLAMSVALVALSPVISVLGGLAAIVGGIAASATAISALGALGGGAGAAAGAAGVAAGASGFVVIGTVIGAALVAYLANKYTPSGETVEKTLGGDGKTGAKVDKTVDAVKEYGGSFGFIGGSVKIALDYLEVLQKMMRDDTPSKPSTGTENQTFLQRMGITKSDPVRKWSDPPAKAKEPAKSPLDPRPSIQGQAESIRTPPAEQSTLSKAWDWITSSFIGSAKANEFIPPPKGSNPASTPTLDPRPAMESLKEAVNDNTLIHKQSLEMRNGFGFGGLIQRASLSTTGPSDTVRSSLTDSANGVRQAVLSGSTGSGVMTGGNGPLGNSVPGSALNGGSGLSRRGIIGGGGDGGGYAPPSNSMAGKTFDAKTPGIMANLMKDLNLSKEQAAGILGNLGHESAGMTAYQEGKPLGGGRGGAGWAQWTGPRRRAFEAWSASKGLDPRSDDANYGFLKHELGTTHKGALASLRRQNTVDGATVDFERTYEAAGVKHYGSRLGYARKAFNGPSTPSQVIGGSVGTEAASNVADNASKLVGLGSSQAAQALGSRMTPGQWCADFVNGSLKSANIRGVNSSIANSFLGWGKEVTDGVKKGDVLVEHRGRGVGQTGGHAGIATGNTRMGPQGLQYEQVSGNFGGRVQKNWENASGVIARRALETTNRAVEASKAPAAAVKRGTDWNAIPSPVSSNLGGISAGAEAINAGSWKPNADKATSPLAEDAPTRRSLADGVPQAAVERATGTGGGGNGGSTSSSATTNNVTINGANMSPDDIASAIQRKTSKDMRRQTTGVSPYSLI
ncbi:phage tail tip lysozyme [Methylobacterium sp. WL19]|uniref:phage tail tip lysozyme n=1 Tax=Methylobacterium sp. WL19 TaxID=2603896 RepID=UPI0011C96017|nr:phage tail tip lysozyme [Methylobacterium sp. WL19]TXN27400.1 hypothetical protein FV220_11600 [Methylobacterium sp. WL19]